MNILKFISKNQMSIQSIIFWIVAISNKIRIAAIAHFSEDKFWYFATAAIIFSGLGDILTELRKSNKSEYEQS